MENAVQPQAPSQNTDDCTICLNALAPGANLITLSCNHKFHLQCLATNVQAQNKLCPLCRATLDQSVVQILAGSTATPTPTQQQAAPAPVPVVVIPSVEELVDETVLQTLSERFAASQQATVNDNENVPLITTVTTLEYGGQPSDQESNIYGLVTLQAPAISQSEIESMATSRLPIDLICVVDQSGSMGGVKINLLKQTLNYIIEQLTELDRLAIVSFNTTAFDRSHGLKRMTNEK